MRAEGGKKLAPGAIETTKSLVARAVAGDRPAFGELVSAHYDMIYRTAFKWCRSQSDAEDVAQEVCVKLATVLRSYDGRAAFSSWLYRITLNAVRDLQRKRARETRRSDALAEVTPQNAPAGQEDDMATSELWQAVRGLPGKQRDAVMLVYSEELSHAEAGEAMGCAANTVAWHIHEAKKALKGLM
jgi:RNA polymerase sigma-70 factor (ECF subfamily)